MLKTCLDYQKPPPFQPTHSPAFRNIRLAIEKVISTILTAGQPSIIGLQEVENIGILEDIAANERLAEAGYQPVLIEGTDSRLIDVGYLVKGNLQILETEQYPAPQGTDQPPTTVDQGSNR